MVNSILPLHTQSKELILSPWHQDLKSSPIFGQASPAIEQRSQSWQTSVPHCQQVP